MSEASSREGAFPGDQLEAEEDAEDRYVYSSARSQLSKF
jgi:hypothetical protein